MSQEDGCQYIGPDQDPLIHWPIKYCGCKTLSGKAYCGEHYWTVYAKGTSVNGKRKEKALEKEFEELIKEAINEETEESEDA